MPPSSPDFSRTSGIALGSIHFFSQASFSEKLLMGMLEHRSRQEEEILPAVKQPDRKHAVMKKVKNFKTKSMGKIILRSYCLA